jgi:hypothetical protein
MLIAAGIAVSVRPVEDILRERQGYCDYLPCVTRATVALLVVGLALLVLGLIALGWAVHGARRR